MFELAVVEEDFRLGPLLLVEPELTILGTGLSDGLDCIVRLGVVGCGYVPLSDTLLSAQLCWRTPSFVVGSRIRSEKVVSLYQGHRLLLLGVGQDLGSASLRIRDDLGGASRMGYVGAVVVSATIRNVVGPSGGEGDEGATEVHGFVHDLRGILVERPEEMLLCVAGIDTFLSRGIGKNGSLFLRWLGRHVGATGGVCNAGMCCVCEVDWGWR
jgi:hypothetical protein